MIEYDNNYNLLPPIGLKYMKIDLDDEKPKTTRFKWNDAIGNKIKKNMVVFKKGSMEELLKWYELMCTILSEQGIIGTTNTISGYNHVLANPSKNHYNNGIQQACNEEDQCIALLTTQRQAAVTNYMHTHAKGLKAIGQIIFPDEAYTAQKMWLMLTIHKLLDITI